MEKSTRQDKNIWVSKKNVLIQNRKEHFQLKIESKYLQEPQQSKEYYFR